MKKFLIGIFFAVIIIFPVLTFLLPKKEFSDTENRNLQKAPTLNVNTIKDKTFMNDSEKYMADHIVLRNQFVKSKTEIELLTGRREINDVYISKDRLLEKIVIDKGSISSTDVSVNAINEFAQKYKDKISTNIMLVPTATEFYKNDMPWLSTKYNQSEYIDRIYKNLNNVNTVDAYSILASSASENNIYYKTDHHWTSYGAYLGYTALSKSLDFKPVSLDMFNVEHASHDFLGTLYSKALCGENLKDSVDLYKYSNNNLITEVTKYTGTKTETYPSIFFNDFLDKKDKYSTFLGGNNSIIKIRTNANNGKKIIIFKDSYANAMMQFLPLNYEEIVLVDLRYLNGKLSDFIDINNYSQALFLYDVKTFSEETTVKKVLQY